jgi:hypothetical protein
MPSKIVDLSARSEVIREEPFHVHFWESTPAEYQAFLGNPRSFLDAMGSVLPQRCRIETVIENHDWLGDHAPDFTSENGTIICSVGGGNIARDVYRIVSYGHDHSTIGKFRKKLLHTADQQQVGAEVPTAAPIDAEAVPKVKTKGKAKDKAKKKGKESKAKAKGASS